jgi:hypothetical protein
MFYANFINRRSADRHYSEELLQAMVFSTLKLLGKDDSVYDQPCLMCCLLLMSVIAQGHVYLRIQCTHLNLYNFNGLT